MKTRNLFEELKKSLDDLKGFNKKRNIIDEKKLRPSVNRTGSFIGMLDGKVGDVTFKEMKQEHAEKEDKG